MSNYKKVYEDAIKVHDMVERLKKSKKAALDNVNSGWVYLDPDEKEFVKNAIIAAYEPRIDNLLKEFSTVYEENKEGRRLRFRVYGEIITNLAEEDIISAKKICSSGHCGSQICPLHGIGGCTKIIRQYDKGEFSLERLMSDD